MGKELGIEAEQFFQELLNKHGIKNTYLDDWYDFEVQGQKVEVKSCNISNKNGVHKQRREPTFTIGRFDFTDPENREKQFEENVWVALIVRHRHQYIAYGFVRAQALKQKRYVSLHKARELPIIDFEEWVAALKGGGIMTICYWDKISRTLKGSIRAKALKFNREHCVEEIEPNSAGQRRFLVKHIPGYNKTDYTVTLFDEEDYDCQCQYANPAWLVDREKQPLCSHKAAVALKIKNMAEEPIPSNEVGL